MGRKNICNSRIRCLYTRKPCSSIFYSDSGEYPCILYNRRGKVVYACVHIRFHGKNSTWEQGFGMTILEKLERQGIVKLIYEKNLSMKENHGGRIS